MNAQVIRWTRAQVVHSLTDSVFFTCSVPAVCHRFLVEITEPKDSLLFQSAFPVRSLSVEVGVALHVIPRNRNSPPNNSRRSSDSGPQE
jgi:hypothetical protein